MYVCTCRFVAVLCYDIAIDLDDYAFLETDEWCWAQADIQPWYATMLSNGNPRSVKKRKREKGGYFLYLSFYQGRNHTQN